MSKVKSQIVVGALAACCGLGVGAGYRASAATARTRTVDQRVAELETTVKMLELKVGMMETALARTPRMGPQAVQQR
jgi:hypothetical protein